MTNILKTLAVALTLAAGTVAASGIAVAGTDATYHWGYPDNLKASANVPAKHLRGGSGIPAQYR